MSFLQLRTRLPYLLLALTIALTIFVRLRLRDMPLERDEGEYAYAGHLILRGVPPYKAAYNMKLPGTYAAYAVIMAVFGQTPAAIHAGIMLVNAASIILVFLLGRKLLDDTTALVAAATFALLCLSPSVLGLAGHATHFVVLAALGGTLLLVGSPGLADPGCKIQSPKPAVRSPWSIVSDPGSVVFLAGLLFGIAFIMKQHGALFGLFGGMYLLWVEANRWLASGTQENTRILIFDETRDPLAPIGARLLWYIAGLALPYVVTCLVLWCAGVFPQFIFWTLSYASKYATEVPITNASANLRTGLAVAMGVSFILWILPAAGLFTMWSDPRLDQIPNTDRQRRRRRRPKLIHHRPVLAHTPVPPRVPSDVQASLQASSSSPASAPQPSAIQHPASSTQHPASSIHRPKSQIPHARFFLISLLVCSAVAVSIGFFFRNHYFILLLPVMALLVGIGVSRSIHVLLYDHTIELVLAVPVLILFVAGVGATLIGNGGFWFGSSPGKVVDDIYGSTIFSEAARAAEYLRLHTPENARVAVLGSEPEIYFYSRRQAGTGYLYAYPLVESQPYARKMQDEMISEIERSRPDYVLYVDDVLSWMPEPRCDRRIFDWWRSYGAANFELVSALPITGTKEAEIPINPSTPFGNNILILTRKK